MSEPLTPEEIANAVKMTPSQLASAICNRTIPPGPVELIAETDPNIVALLGQIRQMEDALAIRDRQLAELRGKMPNSSGVGDEHQQANAWCMVYNELLDHGLSKFMDELRDSGNPECGAVGAVLFIRRLATLLPPPAKEEPRAETK